MAYLVLIRFVDRDKLFRSQLNAEQIKSVQAWARKVPTSEQQGRLDCLKKLYGEGLQLYLSSIIPEFHAEEN
jgi:hypothetical protein